MIELSDVRANIARLVALLESNIAACQRIRSLVTDLDRQVEVLSAQQDVFDVMAVIGDIGTTLKAIEGHSELIAHPVYWLEEEGGGGMILQLIMDHLAKTGRGILPDDTQKEITNG